MHKVRFLKAAWDAIGSVASHRTQHEMFYRVVRLTTASHSCRLERHNQAGGNPGVGLRQRTLKHAKH
jgi:hypothetical protein